MDENIKSFSMEDSMFKSHLSKDLAINVYKNGQWGSYRHLQLFKDNDNKYNNVKKAYHTYAQQLVRSDVSSFTWCEGPLDYNV